MNCSKLGHNELGDLGQLTQWTHLRQLITPGVMCARILTKGPDFPWPVSRRSIEAARHPQRRVRISFTEWFRTGSIIYTGATGGIRGSTAARSYDEALKKSGRFPTEMAPDFIKSCVFQRVLQSLTQERP